MKQLTFQDKKTLIEMLSKHYTIDESAFIKAIAQNEEEEVELTLKAFSLTQRTQEAKAKLVQEDNFEFRVVQIDHFNNGSMFDCKIAFIKAIKETININLVECKAIVDQIMSFGKDKPLFNPFKVGMNNKVYTFTLNQWLAICVYLRTSYGKDAIKWHYV